MHAMSRESWGVAGRESSACQEDILWFEVAEAKAHIVDSLEPAFSGAAINVGALPRRPRWRGSPAQRQSNRGQRR